MSKSKEADFKLLLRIFKIILQLSQNEDLISNEFLHLGQISPSNLFYSVHHPYCGKFKLNF